MDPNLLQLCEIKRMKDDEEYKPLPCQKSFRLLPEDQISLDSIMSALVSKVVPSFEEIKGLKWDIQAKDMLNEKQALIFDENLYISKIKEDNNCLLEEENKILLERHLQLVGHYKLSVEESYDGYVVFSRSSMKTDSKEDVCGHDLTGKYANNLALIAEKRLEYNIIDHARIEKTLNAHLKGFHLIAKRQNKINNAVQKFKAIINMKDRENVFLLDGGVMLLTRYLIVNNFRGAFQYYTMNISGRILRCIMCFHSERKTVRVYNRTFSNVVLVVNTQYFNDVPQDISETYYTPSGHIIVHFWHGFKYIIHSVRAPQKPPEIIIPKLELVWKSDPLLCRLYKQTATVTYEKACQYLSTRPEILDILHDFLLNVLRYKPDNVLEFTIRYCQNNRRNY